MRLVPLFLLAAGAFAAAVPAGHPRVYITSQDLPALREKLTMPEFRADFEAVRNAQDDPRHGYFYSAFVYLATGDKAAGRRAVERGLAAISASDDARTYGMPLHLTGVVYDWCYDLLTADEKQRFIAEFERITKAHSPGVPASLRSNGITGHDTESWVLTGQIPVGVAIYDESKTMFDAALELVQKIYIPARNWHYQGHAHHQGDSYFSRFMYDQTASWLFRRMGWGDILSREQQFVPYQILYNLRPDGQQMRRGDTFDDSGDGYLQKIEDSKRFCAQLTGYYYEDPYLLWAGESNLFLDLGAFEKVFKLLFRKPGLKSKPLSDLPLTKYFAEPIGDMTARTGWTLGKDSPDSIIDMRIGQYFFGNHQRRDFGIFQIYYRGPLAISTGLYASYGSDHWKYYYHPTVSHNGLLVIQPGEGENVTDGGQRLPNNLDHPPNVEVMKTKGYQMGEVTGHQFGPDPLRPEYSYLAGDITKAYTAKVTKVTRSMVAFNADGSYPAAFVVYDRVHSADPSYRKVWLLHSIQEPRIEGRRFEIVRDEKGYGGRLFAQTLLPAEPAITKVGGPGKEFWVETMGKNFPATRRIPGNEPGAWRIEVSPASPAKEDRFLHAMAVAPSSTTAAPAMKKIEARGMTGAEVLDRAVLFSTTGELLSSTAFKADAAKYLVCDLQPGRWTVRGPSRATVTVTPEGKCLYIAARPGSYQLKLVAAAPGN